MGDGVPSLAGNAKLLILSTDLCISQAGFAEEGCISVTKMAASGGEHLFHFFMILFFSFGVHEIQKRICDYSYPPPVAAGNYLICRGSVPERVHSPLLPCCVSHSRTHYHSHYSHNTKLGRSHFP